MKRLVTVLIILLLVLFAMFTIQNAQAVPLSFLVWSTEVSLALLMILSAAFGFIIGMFAFKRSKGRTSFSSTEERENSSLT